uniref:Putative endonuclease-reverse transcriptase n=1 Tax=Rhipicephalus microplus TaxID=6941 RepID=A0A6M2D8S7_RHIMP
MFCFFFFFFSTMISLAPVCPLIHSALFLSLKVTATIFFPLGWSTFGKHSQLMTGRLPLSLKRKVYNSCILPVLSYGAETWRPTKRVQLKSRTTQRAMGIQLVTLNDQWSSCLRATCPSPRS